MEPRLVADLVRRLRAGLRSAKSPNRPTIGDTLQGDEGTALDKLIDGKSIAVTGAGGVEVGYVLGWTSRKIPAQFRPALLAQAGRLELEPWREILKDVRRELPNDLTLIFWDDLPLALWIPAGHVTEFDFNPN